MKIKITAPEAFEARHNSSLTQGIDDMLRQVGVNSLEELMDQTVPVNIRTDKPLDLPAPLDENAFLLEFKNIVKGNSIFKSYIGMGYYDCHTPSVILRNILENPGWYTAYTPYQAEIAQGRLEALVNFQTMICDLTGMELANSSLLDEGTAAAEAMSMFFSLRKGSKKQATSFFVDENTFPQTLDILQTRAQPLGINLVIGDVNNLDFGDADIFGLLLQYPDSNGRVNDIAPLISSGASNDIKVAVAADLLSLVLLKSPGEMGADVVLGSSQRFGVPMGYGGPHAAFFATREEFKRQVPGRIIGLSKDTRGKVAYRMALQTREQHIKRERATSNICTAQVLLAVMSGMYAVYHGPKGLRRIAERVHGLTCLLSEALKKGGIQQVNDLYFDTLKVKVTDMETVRLKAVSAQMNFRYFEDGHIGISLDETTRFEDVAAIQEVLGLDGKLNSSVDTCLQDNMRDDKILSHEV
ncbi:MAG: glycine dehydrogenase (aminomethyl-transferring), partial [Cyclobacteriaceae bacterium]|nr:glycine dehydrogenase (aminomethyl-transferring) [Cyclobacteriaceae bacterium]